MYINIDFIALNISEEIYYKYDIDLMVIIGSYGTDRFIYGESDIDIAFLTKIPLKQAQYMELINDLSAVVKYSKLDLINLNHASALLKYELASKGKLIYEREKGLFIKYSLYACRYYYDTDKFRVLRHQYFEEKLGELINE